MKIFSSLYGLLRTRPVSDRFDSERFLGWLRDPLSHPDIERMDARELGDLPMSRGLGRVSPVPGECRA